jgi:hypothetical protein
LANYKSFELISSLSIPLGLLAELNYLRPPRLPAINTDCVFPSLSKNFPARNERQNLKIVLPYLTDLYDPSDLEILEVDDHSSECTSRVAESYGL